MKRFLYVFLTLAVFSIAGIAQGTASQGPNNVGSPAPAVVLAPKKAPVFRPTKDQITQVQTKL